MIFLLLRAYCCLIHFAYFQLKFPFVVALDKKCSVIDFMFAEVVILPLFLISHGSIMFAAASLFLNLNKAVVFHTWMAPCIKVGKVVSF